MTRQLIDDEGENFAVRTFLMLYGGQRGITTEQMRKHFKLAGFDGVWPDWATSHSGHLTKAGAQLWIRHLFALEASSPKTLTLERLNEICSTALGSGSENEASQQNC